jgi:hypothetical protein
VIRVKLIGAQLAKTHRAFYRALASSFVSTKVHLGQWRPVSTLTHNLVSIILPLLSHLSLGLPSYLFPSDLPDNFLYTLVTPSEVLTPAGHVNSDRRLPSPRQFMRQTNLITGSICNIRGVHRAGQHIGKAFLLARYPVRYSL